MSIATAPPVSRHIHNQYDIRECHFCDAHYPLSYGLDLDDEPDFCRWACYYRNEAASVLDTIERDHRYCASCYRRLKIVYPPTITKKSAERGLSVPDFATGTQHFLDHTERGIGELLEPRDLVNGDAKHVPKGRETTRNVCSCGVCHHSTVFIVSDLSKREAIARTERLTEVVDTLTDEGKVETDYNTNVLFTYIKEAKSRSHLQGGDYKLFRRGLALAIQHA